MVSAAGELYLPHDRVVCGFFDQLADGLIDAATPETAAAGIGHELLAIREQLVPFEVTGHVPILEFVDSDAYLGLGEWVYPSGKWVLDTFYNPQNHWDESRYIWRGQEFVFPGFAHLGLSKEETAALSFNELSIMVGQRSYKSVVSAIIVLKEMFDLLNLPDPALHYGLMPGTPISLSVGATALDQAQENVYYYVEQWRDRCTWYRNYIEKCKTLKLPNGKPVYEQTQKDWEFGHKSVRCNAVHSKSGSLRGGTRQTVVMDEIAHFDEGERHNARAVYQSLRNSTFSFGGLCKRVYISSPLHVTDMINWLVAQAACLFQSSWYATKDFELIDEVNGIPIEKNERMLGFHYPTWESNPTQPYSCFATDLVNNPEDTLRDFGAMPSYAVAAYFAEKERIDDMFDVNRACPIDDAGNIDPNLRSRPGVRYHLHVDVGAGKPANFGLCLAHSEIEHDKETDQDRIIFVVDVAYAVKAHQNGEMDFSKAREILDALIHRFPIAVYSSDGWNDLEYTQKIKRRGITTLTFVVVKEHYDELKKYIYDDRARCHYSPLAALELKRLELKNGTKVEKGLNCTKDVADCIAATAHRCIAKAAKKPAVGRAVMGGLSHG